MLLLCFLLPRFQRRNWLPNILICIPLYVMKLSSSGCLKIFSLSLVLSNLIMMCNFLSYLLCFRFTELLGSMDLLFLSNMKIFWPCLQLLSSPPPFSSILQGLQVHCFRLLNVVHSSLIFFSLFSSFFPLPGDSF